MRYSLIHHDIREKFGLSVFEYMVIDSIHQLSQQFPTTKTSRKIADFLGIDHSTVARCILRGKEKGLLFEIGGGLRTTNVWWTSVTFKDGENATTVAESDNLSQRATKSVAESDSSIINIYNNDILGENKFSQEFEIVPEDRKESKRRADSAYHAVFELWGKYPLNWRNNRTQIAAAKNLLEEHGLEKCKRALEFYEKHKDEDMCPLIVQPSDLDRKWKNLLAFKKKI